MKLMFLTRKDAYVHPGGDTIQLDKIAGELRARGHSVDVRLGVDASGAGAHDLAHVFNLQRPGETAAQISRLRGQGTPVVLSPIYGDTTTLDVAGRSLSRRLLTRFVPGRVVEFGKQSRRVAAGLGDVTTLPPLALRAPEALRRRLLESCHGIYPNSEWEAVGLRRIVGPNSTAPISVVPNGVDLGLLERGWTAEQFRDRWRVGADKFVVSVARFDERKNNLALVRASLETGIPLVMIGRPAPLHVGYYEQCRAEAKGAPFISFIAEPLSQEQLTGAYRAAHAHALVSWLETPGLVSLEAGLCGANLVVGECAPVREYFRDRAWYAAPGGLEDVASALRAAFEAPRNARHADEMIADQYSWSAVADKQLGEYASALARAGVPAGA